MRRSDGFTLIELMLVVAIIGILSSLAIPAYQLTASRARQAEAKANLDGIYSLETAYHGEFNTFGSLTEIGFTPDGATHYTYCLDSGSCVVATVPLDYGAASGGALGVGGPLSGGPAGGGPTTLDGSGSNLGGGASSGGPHGPGQEGTNHAAADDATTDLIGGTQGPHPGPVSPVSGGPRVIPSGFSGHYDAASFEADAIGRISSAPPPNALDVWMIDQSRDAVNLVVGY